jgi:hypothetical protein
MRVVIWQTLNGENVDIMASTSMLAAPPVVAGVHLVNGAHLGATLQLMHLSHPPMHNVRCPILQGEIVDGWVLTGGIARAKVVVGQSQQTVPHGVFTVPVADDLAFCRGCGSSPS